MKATPPFAAAVLLAAIALAGGCATTTKVANSVSDVVIDDERHQWVGRKFANVVDAIDKAFGEPRVEDAEEVVRVKVGVKAEVVQTEETDWSFPSNTRIPLPALQRTAKVYLDFTTSPDASDLSDVDAVTEDQRTSLSASLLKKISDTFDIQVKFDVYGGWDIGPKVVFRYAERWAPWGINGDQQVFVRTEDGWGGRTTVNIDYELHNGTSLIRFANRADYYEALYDTDIKSSLIYRRRFIENTALSAEVGIEYNPYDGDPEKKNADDPSPDDDHAYARIRVVGKIWRPWIEWELVPGYYYKWEQDEPWRWGIDVRLSLLYESYLRPQE